jgi:hypothetical protein
MISGINAMAITRPDGTRGKRPAGGGMIYPLAKKKNIVSAMKIITDMDTRGLSPYRFRNLSPYRYRFQSRVNFGNLDDILRW